MLDSVARPGLFPPPSRPGTLTKAALSLGTRGGEHEGRLQEHIDDLGRLDMSSRTAAERVTMEWLKERAECRKRGAKAPPKGSSQRLLPYPHIYAELPRIHIPRRS
jgi:hypothetical protein